MRKHLDVSALANAARELLNQGDAVGAERVLSPVFSQLRSDASVLHLMGQIKRAQNDLEAAERHFRSAVAFSLDDGTYYNDLGVVLQARGRFDEAEKVFRAAIALLPNIGVARVNLVHCLMAARKFEKAEAEARVYIAAAPSPEAWTLLSQVQRAQEKNEDALVSAATAMKLSPQARGLRLNYAMALERVGRTKEALEAYHNMALQEIDTPELALNLSRALYLEGAIEEAEQTLSEAVRHWPEIIGMHNNLARMRQLRGEGEAATALMEAEIERRPDDLALRLACADVLHRGRHLQRALRVLEQALARAPNSPQLLTAYGVVLDELDRPEEGLQALRRVAALVPADRSAHRNALPLMLRAGRAEEALALAQALRRDDPHDQYLVAHEAAAMRMLGMADYRGLYDYERFVRSYEIPAPRGFFTAPNFNAALADVLRVQHRVNAHPLDQRLPAGTQTARSLLTLDEPNLRAFAAAVEPAIRDYVGRLDGADPFGARRTGRQQMSALWSVRLPDGGLMPNHVHDRGWISSAYYAALSPAVHPIDERAGWLKLGEPNRPPRGCEAEAFVEPKEGLLVLFPSYMWHGTLPFEGNERLSMAFDVLPV